MTAVRATRLAALAYREATGLWPHEAAGCRQVYRGRGVHRNHLAAVYDGEEAGLDTADGTQPFSTVCERHATVCCHDSLTMARRHVTAPEGWCEPCGEGIEGPARWDDEAHAWVAEQVTA